jgi:ankyrin domain protein
MNTWYCPECRARIVLPDNEKFHCRYCNVRNANPAEEFYSDFFRLVIAGGGTADRVKNLTNSALDVIIFNAAQSLPEEESRAVNTIRFMLNHSFSPDGNGAVPFSPLHMALWYEDIAGTKHTRIAKLLIDSGADVNAPDRDGGVPLHRAAYNGNLEIVRYLVEHGAEVNPRNFSVLQSAIQGKHQDVIEYLKTVGAEDYSPGGH